MNLLGRLRYSVGSGRDASAILSQIQCGRPCICSVMIRSGRLVSSGGVAHWTLAIGWTRDQKIILNDPGSTTGSQKQYPIADFEASWRTQGQVYAPVWR